MLNSFLIKNFRLFEMLTIEHLGRLNLIVGRNNSGKSAFLEAVELYVSNASTQVVINLVTNRQETWKGQPQVENESIGINPVRHLFHNHALPSLGDEGITLGTVNSEGEQLHIDIAAYQVGRDESGVINRKLIEKPGELPQDLSDLEFALITRENGKSRRILRLDKELDREADIYRRNVALLGTSQSYNVEVVPTKNMTDERLATLWDQINLTGLDEEAISGLKLLDPTITGIAFVEGTDRRLRNQRIPIVKKNGLSETLPLKSMGDGMTRLFHITVALVNARNGILLIDEFENGLHWSVQPKIWKTVFRLAEKLNVQVFATTHSRDCIVSFEAAWKESEQLGAFFRLGVSSSGNVTATPYTCETLSDAIETDVEIR
jgi:predicted ATP-dependent endonuclease of OLD family